jgi:hypothetical protein
MYEHIFRLVNTMKKLRQWFSMLTLIAFVLTTTMSATSHAMPHDGTKEVQSTKTEAAKDHDCHGHDEAKADSQKTAKNDKDPSGKCCDKGMCKCLGGTCHNGLSQFLGNSGTPLLVLTASKSVFGFDNQFVDSALPNRLKRPPKA